MSVLQAQQPLNFMENSDLSGTGAIRKGKCGMFDGSLKDVTWKRLGVPDSVV